MQNWTNKIVWKDGRKNTYEYYNLTEEQVRKKFNQDINKAVSETYYYDQNGKVRFAWTKKRGIYEAVKKEEVENKENKEMKIITKQDLENRMYYGTMDLSREDVKQAVKFLEENDLIEFAKEPKTFKALVKIVTIGGENKKLYYVTDFHLTENIEEAKLFDQSEEKDGYAYELVNKLV